MEPECSLDIFSEDKIITKVEIKEEPLWVDGKPVEVMPDIQDPLVSGADFQNEIKNGKEDTSKKRKRTENYTFEETLKLLECVKKHHLIVESKKLDAATWKQKDQAWEKISQEYNSSNTSLKTTKMLRGKFESLKKQVRRYTAAHSQSRLQREWDSPSEIKLRTILDKVQEIIQMSAEGHTNACDADKILEADTDNSIDENCLAIEDIPELESLEVDLPVISLESLCKLSYTRELSTQDVGSPCAGEASDKCQLSRCTTPTSSSGEKLSAVSTIQELLREQFTQRERREQELHEYDVQIKKTELQIKKAQLMKEKLDIQIKRRSLRKLDESQ